MAMQAPQTSPTPREDDPISARQLVWETCRGGAASGPTPRAPAEPMRERELEALLAKRR